MSCTYIHACNYSFALGSFVKIYSLAHIVTTVWLMLFLVWGWVGYGLDWVLGP